MGWLRNLRHTKRTADGAVGWVDRTSRPVSAAGPTESAGRRLHTVPVITGALPAHLATPIAGVDLALYARISMGLAEHGLDRGHDQAAARALAAAEGIDAIRWQTAVIGWNERIATDPFVARQFTALYTGRAA